MYFKRIATILTCLLFLVAIVPGGVMQELVDPLALCENSSSETPVAKEEKTEEHFLISRSRLQQSDDAAPVRKTSCVSRAACIKKLKPNPEKVSVPAPETPLYIQHSSWLL